MNDFSFMGGGDSGSSFDLKAIMDKLFGQPSEVQAQKLMEHMPNFDPTKLSMSPQTPQAPFASTTDAFGRPHAPGANEPATQTPGMNVPAMLSLAQSMQPKPQAPMPMMPMPAPMQAQRRPMQPVSPGDMWNMPLGAAMQPRRNPYGY